MDPILYIFFVYFWVVLVNACVMAVLWRNTRSPHYGRIAIAWGIGAISLFAGGLTAPMGYFGRLLGFSVAFFFYCAMAWVLAELSGASFRFKGYASIFAASLAAAFALDRLGVPERMVAFVICLATGLPAIREGGKVVIRGWSRHSLMLRGFAITLLVDGFHALDYSLVYDNPPLAVAGFSGAVALGIGFAIFGLSSIMEKAHEETGRLELELKFKAKLGHAAKLSALGEMAGGVAHEINNPLAVITLYVERIAEAIQGQDSISNESAKKSIAVVQSHLSRVAKVVAGLMAFAGEAEDEAMRLMSFRDIVEDTLTLYSEKIRSRGAELRQANPDLLNWRINCRPHAISQVVLNLLANALDAVEKAPEKWIQLEYFQESNGFCAMAVTDSGQGIQNDLREKIFQPFFTTKDIGKGTGLGLSVAKGIVEAHGGTLELDPPSPRTRFVLRLPVASA
jgi:signal transduction histidine kinase